MNWPSSTYRLQLHKDFTFHQLEEILDYLHELGISTIYASPITAAFKGSQHGYDVTDPLMINPEIGTEAELAKLSDLLKARNMTWLQDIVPNHMAYVSDNSWLWDVLQRGKNSEYYRFFDINTEDSRQLTGPRIMAPFLGKTLTECLQNKEIKLQFQLAGRSIDSISGADAASDSGADGFVISYYDNNYPVAIPSWQWMATVAEGCPPDLLASLQQLEIAAEQSADKWFATRNQWIQQTTANHEWLSFLQQRVLFFNEQPALLAELVNNQHYILTHGHLAASRINYRRFFTVSSLICLRMEDPSVFAAYHTTIRDWYQKGYIQGLRVDHIDGLAFPRQYLQDLKQLLGEACYVVAEKILAAGEQLPENWQLEGTSGYDFLSLVNQLLTDETGHHELTTFYRNQINASPAYEDIVFSKKITFLKSQMGGEWDNLMGVLMSQPTPGLDTMDKAALKEALGILMASFPVYRVYPEPTAAPDQANQDGSHSLSEVNRKFSPSLSEVNRKLSPSLSEANQQPVPSLSEVNQESSPSFSEADRNFIDQAFSKAAARYPAEGSRELTFLKDLFREPGIFQARLMQFTGPLAAKGVEDTTFYTYNPLISRNEVGDNPSIESITSTEFHKAMIHRQTHLPYSMNATATHDTKRGEDARIRLNWLTAIPEEWIAKVTKWQQLNQDFIGQHGDQNGQHGDQNGQHGDQNGQHGDQNGQDSDQDNQDNGHANTAATNRMPSSNDEYLIYQALLGSFPEDLVVTDTYRERIHQYLTKALREAKENTNYDNPNEAYEKKCHEFLTAILQQESAFLQDFIPFVYQIIRQSTPYSLSQTLLKLTAPGIPDIYQGSESWDLSLVDPDNRLPVDYASRKKILAKIREAGSMKNYGPWATEKEADAGPWTAEKGAAGKLFTIHKTLTYRNQYPQVFTAGAYIPVTGTGALISYMRRHEENWALVIVPLIRRGQPIPETLSITLPADAPSDWVNLFTDEAVSGKRNPQAQNPQGTITLEVTGMLSAFPVALLVGKSS